jgi:hypothetical protein
MAQDSRTTNDIINNAFYLIGEITPDVIPPASMIARGLFLLNDLLDSFSGEGIFIPNIKEINVNLTPGQAKYTVSNIVPADFVFNRIVELDFVLLTVQTISYPVQIVDRAVVLNNVRYPSLQAMPSKVYLDRLDLQTDLTFYPTPNLAYATTIKGKFMLDRLSLFQVINEVPPYFYRFLRYALARELRSYYPSSTWADTQENEYQKMYQMIKGSSEINILIDPDAILMQSYRYGYYDLFGVI